MKDGSVCFDSFVLFWPLPSLLQHQHQDPTLRIQNQTFTKWHTKCVSDGNSVTNTVQSVWPTDQIEVCSTTNIDPERNLLRQCNSVTHSFFLNILNILSGIFQLKFKIFHFRSPAMLKKSLFGMWRAEFEMWTLKLRFQTDEIFG